MNPKELPPPVQLMKFIFGKWISKPIYAAAELGIADLLADGPKSIDELARLSNSHAPSLYRMMRALASVGVFAETDEKHFTLTPMAECLKTGAMRTWAQMVHADWNDKAWDYFLDNVKTGETAFEKAHDMPLFRWLGNNPQAAELLSEANAIKAANSHRAIVEAYDFSGIHTLIDIGGGHGALMAEILEANPAMKGIVADLPPVLEGARKTIREREFENRCELRECDFFRKVPTGGDAYLLSHILHDWQDEQCKTILDNCRKAMKLGSRLLVVEIIVPSGNQPSIAKLLDLEMMIITGGRERTLEEFKNLFQSSGFRLSPVIPTKEGISILEGIPV